MATSGSVSPIQYPAYDLIEQACRRCGQLPGRLSAEEVQDCRNELQMMMNSMIMEGVLLWTVDKQIYGLNLNQNLLQLDQSTIDIENILYRFNNLPSGGVPSSSAGGVAANAFDQNLNTACTQTSTNGNISYNFTTQVTITNVGILPNVTGTLNPVYEYYAADGTWQTAIAATGVSIYNADQWYWVDVPQPQSGLQFRVRETSGGTLDLVEVVFSTQAREILISRINKDDYQNLPFKNQLGRPLQYWFDRQIIPQMWVWPASQYTFNSLVVWRRRVLQNVGDFTNEIEFPPRALDMIIWSLAARILYILPGADINRGPLIEQKAAVAKNLFFTEERDNSPFYISPEIRGYTGGGGSSGSRGGRA